MVAISVESCCDGGDRVTVFAMVVWQYYKTNREAFREWRAQ